MNIKEANLNESITFDAQEVPEEETLYMADDAQSEVVVRELHPDYEEYSVDASPADTEINTPHEEKSEKTEQDRQASESECESVSESERERLEDMEERIMRAYRQGRNEAIVRESDLIGNTNPLRAMNRTPGIIDPDTPPSDPALGHLFQFRPSVWE